MINRKTFLVISFFLLLPVTVQAQEIDLGDLDPLFSWEVDSLKGSGPFLLSTTVYGHYPGYPPDEALKNHVAPTVELELRKSGIPIMDKTNQTGSYVKGTYVDVEITVSNNLLLERWYGDISIKVSEPMLFIEDRTVYPHVKSKDRPQTIRATYWERSRSSVYPNRSSRVEGIRELSIDLAREFSNAFHRANPITP